MAAPREFTPEREETPMTDIELAFERLIECLEEFNENLTDDQYKRLQEHLPSNLTEEELGEAVGKLVSVNSTAGDFGNALTAAYKEAIQISPSNLTKEQLVSISELLPIGSADRVIETAECETAMAVIGNYIKQKTAQSDVGPTASQEVAQLASVLLRRLDTGFNMDQLTMLCDHYDGADTVTPVVNRREKGTIIDNGEEVTINIPFTMPKRLNDLSDDIMEIADKLAECGYTVDSRAWDHLLVYAPQHSELKKRLKKIEKAVGLTKLRKQIKRVVS